MLLLSQFLVFFTGMAGRIGFSGAMGEKFRNRYSAFGHSGYFVDGAGKPNNDYMRRHWVPLLTSERRAPVFDLRPPPTTLDSFTEKLSTHAGLIKLAREAPPISTSCRRRGPWARMHPPCLPWTPAEPSWNGRHHRLNEAQYQP